MSRTRIMIIARWGLTVKVTGQCKDHCTRSVWPRVAAAAAAAVSVWVSLRHHKHKHAYVIVIFDPAALSSPCLSRRQSHTIIKQDACQSPTISPPGYLLTVCVYSPPYTTSACAQRPTCDNSPVCYRHLANIAETQKLSSVHQNSVLWTRPTKIGCHSNVPWGIKELISAWSSTAIANPSNLVMIGLVDFEIIGLTVLWHCWLGGRIRPVKKLGGGCWRGYLSGARCRLAYGPADATATHCLLL